MKQLVLTLLLSVSIMLVNAQQSDTLEIQRNKNGNVTYARFKNSESRKLKDGVAFLKQILKGTENDNFKLIKEDTDKLGVVHLRYQQYYKGIKVNRAEFSLHGKGGNIEVMNGHYANVSLPSIKPAFDESQALEKVLSFVNAKKYKWEDAAMEKFAKENSKNPNATYYPKGELVIVKDSLNNFQLAWKFVISTLEPNDELLVIINAITGKLINKRTLILDNNIACVAQTLYSTNQNITGDTYVGGIRLSEVRNNVNIHTLNMRNQLNNYLNAAEFSNNNTNWTTGSWANINQDQAALDAHWAGEMVFDYWHNVHNRNSINGSGIPVTGYVHFYVPNSPAGWPDNAAWVPGNNNHFMEYGDGDGTTFRPFVALDIAAHEFGHGVNEFTSDLGATTNGLQEEDALNEGLSDIWGICVKNFAAPNKPLWLLGGEILLNNAFNCIRNAQVPKSIYAQEGPHPDTYHKQYWSSTGEPHTNSTVLSHWFSLLSQGGSGTNDNYNNYSVIGVGINEAEQIVYQAEAHYLQPGDGYSDARNAMITAATDLYCANSPEVAAVTNAWYAVGVGTVYNQLNEMSISGPSYICTSGSYSVINVPSGFGVNGWSTSNSLIASINTSGNAAKVSNGSVYFSASIHGTSGCTTTLTTKAIPIGVTPVSINASQLPVCNGSSQEWILSVDPASYGFNYNWTVGSIGGGSQIYIYSPNSPNTNVDVTGGGSINLTYTDVCGNNLSGGVTVYSSCYSGYAVTNFTVAPNPAQNEVTVSAGSNSNLMNPKTESVTASNLIYGIRITDVSGTVRKSFEYKAGIKSIKISVAGLSSGVYTLSVFDGKQWQSQNIIIQK